MNESVKSVSANSSHIGSSNRRIVKPQSLSGLSSKIAPATNEDIGESGGSTPNEDYKTPSTESAPFFPSFQTGPTDIASSSQASNVLAEPIQEAGGSQGQGYGSIETQNSVTAKTHPQGSVELKKSIKLQGKESTYTAIQPAFQPTTVKASAVQSHRPDSQGSVDVPTFKGPAVRVPTSQSPVQKVAAAPASTLTQMSFPTPEPLRRSTSQKKTSFAITLNQTTWINDACQRASSDDNTTTQRGGGDPGGSTDLSDIRQKLEERRRLIETERKRIDAERASQRQAVGKEALAAVMTKSASSMTSSGFSSLDELKDQGPVVRGPQRQLSSSNLTRPTQEPPPVSEVSLYLCFSLVLIFLLHFFKLCKFCLIF